MITRDVNFCENMYDYVQSLTKRSTLISNVSEKESFNFSGFFVNELEEEKTL